MTSSPGLGKRPEIGEVDGELTVVLECNKADKEIAYGFGEGEVWS